MSANKPPAETPVGAELSTCQGMMDGRGPSAPTETPSVKPTAAERPPPPPTAAGPPAATEKPLPRPPTAADSAVKSGALEEPGGSKVEPGGIQSQICEPPVQRNASSSTAVPKRTTCAGQPAAPQAAVAATPTSMCIVSRVPTPGTAAAALSAGRMAQLSRPTAWTPLAPGRTMVIALPRTASPGAVTVGATARPPPHPAACTASPRAIAVAAVRPPPQPAATAQLPANFHIPAGMVLIRSESGQLMLVSQQALVQVQQGQRAAASAPEPRAPSGPVQPVGDNKTSAVRKEDKVTIIRLSAPASVQKTASPCVHKTAASPIVHKTAASPIVHKTAASPIVHNTAVSKPAPKAAAVVQTVNAVVPPVRKAASQDPPLTITQETLENVKKCKNFLVTLIRLASSGSQSAHITSNVKGLVKSLLDGSIEAEEFTAQLYKELKSTPQPYLLPFLKKSLPAVRHLTTDPQLFVQQADQPKPHKTTAFASATNTRPPAPGQLVTQQQQQSRVVSLRASVTRPGLAQQPGPSKNHNNNNNRPVPKHVVLQSRQQHAGPFAFKQPLVHNPPPSNRGGFNVNAGSYREEDDINDVASMAGVNVREEKAKIFSSSGCGASVGQVLRSCPDEPFLPGGPLLEYILQAGQCMGLTDVAPEVTAVLSHATQERLRGLLEKLSAMARHRKTLLKEDRTHSQVSDVRAQLGFMEDVETLKRRRQDEEERERLLRIARRRWNPDDPLHQQLKQQAKELQQLEQAQQQHREANMAALAAIGPRKKRPLQTAGNQQVAALCRVSPVPRVTRVTLRDLLACLEEDHSLRHSVLLYRALLA